MAERGSKRRDRQVVRILGILGVLLKDEQPAIRDLASRFGTRRETIYRDLRALEDAGYPISGDESGRLSHPRLLPEARRNAPHLRLSDEEITALLWASRQAAEQSPFREALGAAAAKLRAMARQEGAAGIEAVMTEGGWGMKDYGPHRETILRLVEAILRHSRCEVEYQSPAAAAAKAYPYDPYRLVSVAGGLYCLGQVPPHANLTTLAVERIRALRITDSKFEIDPALDLDRCRRESFGVIWEKPMNVIIRFSPDQASYVRERIWHPTQRIRELPDGRIKLSFRAGGMFEIARWVLGWGDAAEVLRPRHLRESIAKVLHSTVRSYER
ncbi:MAG: WYL domain-containing protein [Bryobacterales bacterium]|nr:WYL domain-containing protein [Bryobacterales bacterium]